MVLTSISIWYQDPEQWKLFHHDAGDERDVALEHTERSVDMESKEDKENKNMTRSMSVNEKILEEVVGDVKKMNGTGEKLFNEAIAKMSSTIIDQSIVTNKNINHC